MKRSWSEVAGKERTADGEEEEDEDEAFRALAARTDTELVMDDIIRRCGLGCPGIVLLHMVYYELSKNKSIVDQEVDRLRQSASHKILHFPQAKLSGVSGTVVGIISTHRYTQDLLDAFRISAINYDGSGRAKEEEAEPSVETKFADWVRKSTCISISGEDLARESQLTEKQIEELLRAGFLRPRTDAVAGQVDSLWLSHPSFGSVLSRLRVGQAEVTKIVQRRRFKEITEAQFHALFIGGSTARADKKSTAKVSSSLPSTYILQDLLGRGCFQKVQRPTGEALLRLTTPN